MEGQQECMVRVGQMAVLATQRTVHGLGSMCRNKMRRGLTVRNVDRMEGAAVPVLLLLLWQTAVVLLQSRGGLRTCVCACE